MLYARPDMTEARRPPRRKAALLASALVVAGVIATAPALAAESAATPYPDCAGKSPTADDSELAHQKYIAGKQDYDEGNYDSAIRRFRDAYARDCSKHELLVIISAAYERKGDKREASAALELYVERAPNAPDIGTYKAKIENLKRQIAAESSAARSEYTPYPWIVVGVGVAATVVGVALVLTAPPLPGNCHTESEQCDSAGLSPQELSDAESRAGRHKGQTTGGIITIAGGAVIAIAGLVWHFIEPSLNASKEAPAPQTSFLPLLGPGLAGVSLGRTF